MPTVEDLKKKTAEISDAVKNRGMNRENVEKMAQDLLQASHGSSDEVRKGQFRAMDSHDEIFKGVNDPEDFIISKSIDPEVSEFQKWQDDVLILSTLLSKTYPSQDVCNPRTLKTWKKGERRFSKFIKAMSDTSGSGQDWIPTLFSSQLIDVFHLEQRVEALFDAIDPMPSDPFKIPIVSSEGSIKIIAESTSDSASKITATTPGTSNITLETTKLGIRMVFSEELSEDSIIPIMPFLKRHLGKIMALGMEDAIINGDTSTTHMDTDVTSATDPRKAWNGLRAISWDVNAAGTTTALDVAGAQLALVHVRTIRGYLGKYGADPSNLVYITSPTGALQVMSITELVTLDKYGPNATILKGEVGRIDNVPVVISEKVRENLNGSGFYDSTSTDKTLLLCVFRPGFCVGTRRKMTLKTFTDIQTDQQILVGLMRKEFETYYPGEAVVSQAYDVPKNLTS